MAVYAAHLTRTLQGTPSVFQVTAQDALGATVKPALKKVAEFLSAVYPNFDWTVRWYDELYLILDSALQYHYLKHYAASFSESFYGLLRVPISHSSEFNSGVRLPVSLERGSLLLLVCLPYVREKLEKIVDEWREADENGALGKSKKDLARKAAIRAFSLLHFAYETLRLVQTARYIAGWTRAPSIELAVLGLALKDAPPQEDDHADMWRDLGRSLLRRDLAGLSITFPMVGWLLLRGVEYGAFLVQFLRWWQAKGEGGVTNLATPPPPPRDERVSRCINKCPLCLQPWKIPAVLPASGYVFCYMCISRHLRTDRRCPVTNIPSSQDQLIRMYTN